MTANRLILDLCGGTGSWSKPYRDAGYDVRLITLPDTDVKTYQPPADVHGILAAPPCTHFTNSGAQYWNAKDRDGRTLADTQVITACLRIIAMCQPKWWAMENPTGRFGRWMGKPQLVFNPCDYGDPYTKRTCLWGRFAEPVKTPVEPEFVTAANGDRYSKVFMKTGGTSARTKELRSITPPGFAKAFFRGKSLIHATERRTPHFSSFHHFSLFLPPRAMVTSSPGDSDTKSHK